MARVRVRATFGPTGEIHCSFCGRPSAGIRRLVAGPGEGPNRVFICNECVGLCAELLAEMDQ